MRSIRQRNKRKLLKLHRLAQKNDLTISEYVEVTQRMNGFRQFNRVRKCHGCTIHWELAFAFDPPDMALAPIYVKDRLMGYELLLKPEDLPDEYRSEWGKIMQRTEVTPKP